MSDLNTITSQLWNMANELRGNMDASEYKNYILAFMFYRYLSEHQERYLISENVIDIKDGQSINDAYKEQASGKDKDDYIEDISASLGYAIEPNLLSLLSQCAEYGGLATTASNVRRCSMPLSSGPSGQS
jgi:type I restriction enzyme M protein